MKLQAWVLCLAATMGMFAAGCGGDGQELYPVTGTVKFKDGTPLKKGRVIFTSSKGTTGAVGQIDGTGNYVMGSQAADDGVAPGSYTVAILGANEDTPPPPDPAPENYEPVIKPLIAQKYTSTKTSGIQVEVKPEDNTIDLTVEKP